MGGIAYVDGLLLSVTNLVFSMSIMTTFSYMSSLSQF